MMSKLAFAHIPVASKNKVFDSFASLSDNSEAVKGTLV